eukprot:m.340253 g.340253  ORF g.340253 m.340253 type:complete len:767 (+) comp19209_c0_seq1:136-2436(+)
MSSGAEDNPVLNSFQNDELFSKFFEDKFDASRFANSIIQVHETSVSLEKLADGIARVESELHSQVVSHHDDLLLQATGIQKLEDVLKMVSTRVKSLHQSFQRIQDKVTTPYKLIQTRAAQLIRLQSACEILRRTLRYLYLAKRLKTQLQGGNREVAKAAATLTELNDLMEYVDLSGVDVVDKERKWIEEVQQQIESSAVEMLNLSMASHNQIQLGTALQVFRNLGRLRKTVDGIISDYIKKLEQGLDDVLSDTKSNKSDAKAGRAARWGRMETFMNTIVTIAVSTRNLERVLAKKKDPTTQARFLHDVVEPGKSLVGLMWETFTAKMQERFTSLKSSAYTVYESFVLEYPRMLRLIKDTGGRIEQQFSSSTIASNMDMGNSTESDIELKLLLESLKPFESTFIDSSLERMYDPVRIVFPSGGKTPPSSDEVASICKTFVDELNVASVDVSFSFAVGQNIAKTIQLYTNKSELMVSTNKDATQVTGKCSQSLLRNIALANRLDQLCKVVASIISSQQAAALQEDAIELIEQARHNGIKLLATIVDPICEAILVEMEKLIVALHSEDYITENSARSDFASLIQDLVAHVQSEIFKRLTCHEVVVPRVKKLVQQLLRKFAQHVSLIKSLSEAGKRRLSEDMAEFELALSPFQVRVSDLGTNYLEFRALRRLLFLNIEQITNSLESLSTSMVAHHLFSHGPSEMVLPHMLNRRSPEEYCQWMDNHSEAEILSVIRSALDAYASVVKDRGDKTFHPVFPTLSKLCQPKENA